MIRDVFLTTTSSLFPNEPILNEEMEDYLGRINGKNSRCRSIVLRQNGIKCRYYALNKQQGITHTNAELAKGAVEKILEKRSLDIGEVSLLACGTSSPDQLLPSQASMIHGVLGGAPLEIFQSGGVCLTSLQALKIAFWAVASGEKEKAVCCTSELASPTLISQNYDIEYERCSKVGTNPYMAFEKDFLRFMLSDGASAALLEAQPNGDLSYKIEWIEMTSYANELPTCMFMGAELREDGELKSWKNFSPQERLNRSIFVVKQDIRLLKPYIIKYWVNHIEAVLAKHKIGAEEIDYVLPHVSSMFFYNKLLDEIKARNLCLGEEKWYTNLSEVGNIASAAILSALDYLPQNKNLKSGDKILLLVPESGRFSYGTALLTLV